MADELVFKIDVGGSANAELKKIDRSLDEVGKSAATTGRKMSGAFDGIGRSVIAAAAGFATFGAAAAVVKDALKSAIEQDALNRRLVAGYGAAAGALLKQADALQRVTAFGDDEIITAQIRLRTMGLTAAATEKLIPSLLDMATVTGSVESASLLIGKALAGNTATLGRYGIVLTDAQKKTLDVGTESEKLAVVIDALQTRFGGQAKSQFEAYAKGVEPIVKAFGELAETVGAAVIASDALGKTGLADTLWAWNDAAADASGGITDFTNQVVALAKAAFEAQRTMVDLLTLDVGSVADRWGKQITSARGSASRWFGGLVTRAATAGVGGADVVPAPVAGQPAPVVPVTPKRPPGGGGSPKSDPYAEYQARVFDAINESAFASAVRRAEREDEINAAMVDGQFVRAVTAAEREDEIRTAMQDGEVVRAIANQERIEAARLAMTQRYYDVSQEAAQRVMSMATATLSNGIADAVVDGKAAWGELGKSLEKELIAALTSAAVRGALLAFTNLLFPGSGTTTGGAAGGGGVGDFIRSALGFHTGGSVGKYHDGGSIPRAHSGMYVPRIGRDEVPIIAQRGEYVMQRSAVNRVGRDTMDALNRGSGGVSTNVSVTINAAPGQSAQSIADAVIYRLRSESARGKNVVNRRGVQ